MAFEEAINLCTNDISLGGGRGEGEGIEASMFPGAKPVYDQQTLNVSPLWRDTVSCPFSSTWPGMMWYTCTCMHIAVYIHVHACVGF